MSTNPTFSTHEDAAMMSKEMLTDEVFEFQGHVASDTMASTLFGGFNARKAGRFLGIRASVGTAVGAGSVTVRLSNGVTNIDLTLATLTSSAVNAALSQAFAAGEAWRLTLTGAVDATAANLVVTVWGEYTR
jgi:hypothetical protein